MAEIETAPHGYNERPAAFEPDEIARAGAIVSIDGKGRLRFKRCSVRQGDRNSVAPEPDAAGKMGGNL